MLQDSDLKGGRPECYGLFQARNKQNVDKKYKVPNNDKKIMQVKIDLTNYDYQTLPLHTNYMLDETSCSFIT